MAKPYAYVNHGRWVVDCPTPHCPEAHLARPSERFDCQNCGELHDKVVFPDDRLMIDGALAARPVPQTRNWVPGETIDDLLRENREHGLDDT